MTLIIEWNASANMFYLLKNLLFLILVILKLKCNNLIFTEIMVLNASYVCLHAFLLRWESPDPDPRKRTPHFWGRSITGTAPKLSDVESSATGSSTQCAATVSLECTTRPSPNCSNLPECTSSGKPQWQSLFQVWVDSSLCMAVPYRTGSSWSRESEQATRATEFHVWKGKPYDKWWSSASTRCGIGYVSRMLTSYNNFIQFWSIAFIHNIKLCCKT
jgi:hypothetical protein